MPSERTAVVLQVGFGNDKDSLVKQPCSALEFTLEGVLGDKHAGFTRKSDDRDTGVKRGTIIRNWRQWSAVSSEELEKIAAAMKVPKIEPAWLGANITFKDIEHLSLIPKGSQIWFESGLVLTVEGENAPCIGPGKEIARHFAGVSAHTFPKAAKLLRGLVGVVYRPGKLSVGDRAVIVEYTAPAALPDAPRTQA